MSKLEPVRTKRTSMKSTVTHNSNLRKHQGEEARIFNSPSQGLPLSVDVRATLVLSLTIRKLSSNVSCRQVRTYMIISSPGLFEHCLGSRILRCLPLSSALWLCSRFQIAHCVSEDKEYLNINDAFSLSIRVICKPGNGNLESLKRKTDDTWKRIRLVTPG